ncbi:TonB-dependent receptor plug domain-containing protein [Solimonas variicoloris]|uniref:TonB-dependent receptor plug domain-containing protein n=1 Tax=Solimonas variicoloris TaxID=254408 RepID=UPI0005853793|nr:TonB-dependent receptor [Solimonas variicoloris]
MKSSSVALLGAAAFAAVPALVQAADAPAAESADGDIQQIIVTGTRAKDRTVLDSAVPVDVITAQDLQAAGSVNGELGQALQVLLPSFSFPRQSNSGGADHVRAAQLRGLSPDQVLVLINGKRWHTSALVNDSSKIGRGTAPVDFNSIPINAVKRIEVLRDGAGAQYGSDAIAGVINVVLDDGADGGELAASYGLYHTREDAIDKTITDGQNVYSGAKIGTRLGDDGGFLRAGAEYKHRNPTNRAGYDHADFLIDESNPAWGQRNYAMGDGAARDVNLWFNGSLPVAIGEVYSFATYNHRNTTGYNFFRYNDEAPDVYPDGFLPQSLGENQDLGATAGLRGRIGTPWSYDFSVTHGRNQFDAGVRHTLNESLGTDSPKQFDTGTFELRQTTANLDFTRDLPIGARRFLLAFGGEYRYENYRTSPGDAASYAGTGAVGGGGLRPSDTANLDRNEGAFYLDLSGDIADRLFVEGAARYEHYDDAGGKLTGKLSGRYEFARQIALRGAVSNSFRAPSLAQVGFQSTTSNFGEGGTLNDIRVLSVNDPIARALGARRLDPETARNFSLGISGQLTEQFDYSLDVFHIDVDQRITLSTRIGDEDGHLEQYIEDNFGVAGVQYVNFFTNAADTRTDGAELVLNYHQQLYGGRFGFSTAYTYNRNKVRSTEPTPAELQAIIPGIGDDALVGVEERNTLTDASPRDRLVVSSDWRNAKWSLLGRLTRQGETTRVFDFGGGFHPTQTYGARWQLDAEVEYRITPQLALALGGDNLTDNYPERSNADINYGGNLPYDVLSPLGSNGAYYYERLTYSF